MIPRIKVNVGRGLDPIELQQLIDTDLQTNSKTVVGAINELLDTIETIDTSSAFNPVNGALLETITQEMITNWNAAEPTPIEKIFVNNAEVSIIDKSVSLAIPTQASDIGAALADHDHDGVYLKTNEMIPESLLPAFTQDCIIETFKMVDTVLPVKEKTVQIPKASATSYGVVKSSSGANKATVETDGTMKIGVISTSSLKVPIGEVFVLNGGTSDSADPVYTTRINNIGYDSVAEAVAAAGYGDVVTIQSDVNLGTEDSDHLVVSAENVTLDLASSTMTASGSSGAINVTGGSTTITGDGTIEGTLGSDNYSMAVWATGGKVVIEGGTYTNATDGSERGTDLIYASGDAQIEITGGTFIAATPEWTLNCRDADYKAGTANIIVKGGKFYMFDPANNDTEGVGTNYVAEGYKSTKEGDYYVVTSIA